jgi:response regulator RpfG family c-di-GMP phosphodiesterase
MTKVLLCEQNESWLEKFQGLLDESMFSVSKARNGREVQSYLLNNLVDLLVINVNTKDFSFFEVLKFVKQNQPRTLVVVLVDSVDIVDEYFYSDDEIKKLGITQLFIKPFPILTLVKYISTSFHRYQWKGIGNEDSGSGKDNLEEEVKEADSKFTSLRSTEFSHSNISIFDLYIRLGINRYIKIFHEGDKFDCDRIRKYEVKDPDLRIFFKNSDRLTYINFTNVMTARDLGLQKETNIEHVRSVEAGTRIFIEEIYLSGFSEQVREEAFLVCDNMWTLLNKNINLRETLSEYVSESETELGHVYLTAFYTGIVCKHLEWVSEHSRGNIMMGAFLHDIGKLKLSKIIRSKKNNELSLKEMTEYRKHPEYGVDLLDRVGNVSEQIKQIVYQHHEVNTGEGFPNGLTGRKIYPLAKIVAFCDFMSIKTDELKCSPFETLIHVMKEKNEILLFEPEVVKAFIQGFVNNVEI